MSTQHCVECGKPDVLADDRCRACWLAYKLEEDIQLAMLVTGVTHDEAARIVALRNAEKAKQLGMKDLENPAFVQWLKQAVGDGPIRPDDQDYDANANPTTDAERAHEYRLMQARKLLRLYGTWKARQN